MLNFFSKTSDGPASDGTVYRFKEPSFRQARPSGGRARQAVASATRAGCDKPAVLPTNYGDIVEFFRRTVADRRSPYNQLCRAADQLKDYIPDEISRLQVAYGMLKDQLSAESLSLAISTHIGDIDLARQKAARHTPELAAAESRRLQQEIETATQRWRALVDEIDRLKARLAQLQPQLAKEEDQLSQLKKVLDSVQSSANSAAFLDQAAENEKSDLLAKKALLGLP